VVTCGLEIKIYVEDMIGAISIEFYSLVLANKSAFVPKDIPSITPRITNIKIKINH
jgi:hypothetical protein